MFMYWQIEIPIIVRNLIGDFSGTPTYSDSRIIQLAVVAAQYVLMEVNLDRNYTVNVVTTEITPDPSAPESRDTDFIGFIAMKAACLLDHSTFRTRAAGEGLRAALGPASLSVTGTLAGYKDILNTGPCKLYDQLVLDHNIGNATAVRAVFSPFVGNNFDAQNLNHPTHDYSRLKDNQFF
jgi:hypothetical protein